VVSKEKAQAHILIGARGVTLKNPDRYPLEVLQAVLSGQGGRLFLDLRDRESLAYSVTAFSQEGVEPGAFGVYIATSPQKLEQAIQGIREQLRRVTTEKISTQELDRAKTYLIGTFEIGLQTNAAQSSSLAFNERYGLGFNAYREYPKRIEAVTADKVLEVAQRYLSPDRLSLAILKPEKAGPTSPGKEDTTHAVPGGESLWKLGSLEIPFHVP
jgi:zinc protease